MKQYEKSLLTEKGQKMELEHQIVNDWLLLQFAVDGTNSVNAFNKPMRPRPDGRGLYGR